MRVKVRKQLAVEVFSDVGLRCPVVRGRRGSRQLCATHHITASEWPSHNRVFGCRRFTLDAQERRTLAVCEAWGAGVRAPKQWLPCSISLSISTIVVLNGTTSSCIPWISNNGSDRPAEKVIGEFLLRKRTRLTLKLFDNAAHEMEHADKRGAHRS